MKLNRFIIIVTFYFGCNFILAQDTIIDNGAVWKYFDLAQEPPIQNNQNWYDIAFMDLNWSSGPGQLGYGDGDEATLIGDTTFTAYFRKNVIIDDTSLYSRFDLSLTYDDGAIVYLNGVEVMRINMPQGAVSYDTFATSGSSDNATASMQLTNGFVNGANVLAVEVHQRSAGSSDLSFDVYLEGIQKGYVALERGPYLQNSTLQSIVIKWRTSNPATSIVNYGLDINNLNNQLVDTSYKINHEIEIADLISDTKYYYQISSHKGILVPTDLDLYFKTSPPTESKALVRAWILGDPGTGGTNARAVRDAYYDYEGSNETDMILFLGDNAYPNGTDADYQKALFEYMYEGKMRNTVSWSTLGNHDGHSASSSDQSGPYYDIFTFPIQGEAGGMASGTEAYYSFDYANVHFIILDSHDSDRSINGPMYSWCESDLQNTSADWVVALWHHPAYSKGSHDSDLESGLIQMRERFLPLLEMYGVDMVLSGHSHSYERSYFLNGHYEHSDSFDIIENTIGLNGGGDGRIDGNGAYQNPVCDNKGAVYITAGSSGKISGNGLLDHEAMYYSEKTLGSCVLEIEDATLKLKFLTPDAGIVDSFTIFKADCEQTTTSCTEIDHTFGDVEERSDSSIYANSSDLEMSYDQGNQLVGLIFQNSSIPQGAAIRSAYIQFTSDTETNSTSDLSELVIFGHDHDNTPLFTAQKGDVSQRTWTEQDMVWEPSPWLNELEKSYDQRTPDISNIIQEIVNRAGYNSSSNIGFTLKGIGVRRAISFDNVNHQSPPLLCIEYTDCAETLFVSNPIHNYSAKENVTSDAKINNPTSFTAGQEVNLISNFEVPIGSIFRAYILGCNN